MIMETIRKQEISSYVIGCPLVLATRRDSGLPLSKSKRRFSQKSSQEKKIRLVGKFPTWNCLYEDLTPRSKGLIEAKMTFLPFIYAQSNSGRNTPQKKLNLPLIRKDQEFFNTTPEDKDSNYLLFRSKTCNNLI